MIIPEYVSEVVNPWQESGDKQEGDRHQQSSQRSPRFTQQRPGVEHFDTQTG